MKRNFDVLMLVALLILSFYRVDAVVANINDRVMNDIKSANVGNADVTYRLNLLRSILDYTAGNLPDGVTRDAYWGAVYAFNSWAMGRGQNQAADICGFLMKYRASAMATVKAKSLLPNMIASWERKSTKASGLGYGSM